MSGISLAPKSMDQRSLLYALLFCPSRDSWLIVIAIIALLFGGSKLPQLPKPWAKAKSLQDGLAEGEEEARRKRTGASWRTIKAFVIGVDEKNY